MQFEGSPGNVGMDGPSVCSAGGLDGDLTMDSIAAFSPRLARPDASPVTGALSGGLAHQCAADTPGSSGNRKWDPFRQPLWESPANFAAAFDITTPITSDYRLTEADVAIAPVSAAGGRRTQSLPSVRLLPSSHHRLAVTSRRCLRSPESVAAP